MPSSKAVKFANKASSTRLANVISSTYDLPALPCTVVVCHSNELKKSECSAIWDIFEVNMRELYTPSSFGWNPESKRKELFHSLSRFLLVYKTGDSNILAFVMFRFETDYDEDIIYCYDIHVSSAAQGLGLGKKLLGELVKLCGEYQMERIFLTVLKANQRAAKLYKSIGFTLDPTSPGYVEEGGSMEDVEDMDYEILSKPI
ncbi:unnamed protein product [Cyclocybe aegerita]|uniref:N-alpha-acetyltransferase 40 n=1 Tax=Cyclocybe aegerita TaxID=1973307 RepID=A0A8S0W875_CYCAE|nr:unnamed protein product [Cyclocybe aegerita]